MLLPDDFSIKIQSKLGEEIIISKGKLKKGAIESRALEKDLLEKLFIKYGSQVTRKFIDNVTQMCLEALAAHGFSVSMKSYTLSDKAEKKVKDIDDRVNREIENLILQFRNGKLERVIK